MVTGAGDQEGTARTFYMVLVAVQAHDGKQGRAAVRRRRGKEKYVRQECWYGREMCVCVRGRMEVVVLVVVLVVVVVVVVRRGR